MKQEIIKREVLWTGNFLRSVLLSYRGPDGTIVEWESFERVGVKGIVAVVPFTMEGDVIVVKQFRPPVNGFVIEFPAGLNDRNESLEEVARRELLEETGYRAERLDFLAEGPLSSGASSEILTVYIAQDIVNTNRQRTDDTEEIEVLKIPSEGFYEHLMALLDRETFIDLKIPGLFEIAKKKIDIIARDFEL
jgi:8-oxo-dGTP pyrophosphatase MutT (NUDIX family)